MKKNLLFIAFVMLMVGCTDEIPMQNLDEENAKVQVRNLDNAVFHEGVQSWMIPQKDPYTLANFQEAYDNLALGKSTQVLTRAQAGEFSGARKLKATHYTLKVFPKTEDEQEAYERDKELDVIYHPFDYEPLTAAEVKSLKITDMQPLEDERRYTVTYEGIMTPEGPAEPRVITLPVLYVVWPCGRPFPADMDYEILSEVFLPDKPVADRTLELSTDALAVLKREALGEVNVAQTRATLATGRVQHYDNQLRLYLPMTQLRIRFRWGSSMRDVYTDYRGYFDVDSSIPTSASITLIFGRDRWKIVEKGKNSPIEEPQGTLGVQLTTHGLNYLLDNSAPDPRYECFRAAAFYFEGAMRANGAVSYPPITAAYYPDPPAFLIEARYDNIEQNPSIGGIFYYSKYDRSYIGISNQNRANHARLFGTILHELGHFSHYALRGNYDRFKSVSLWLKEAWASYAGWEMTELYYEVFGRARTPFTTIYSDITGQARQAWQDGGSEYGPRFVDLQDDFNQRTCIYGGPTYPNDAIKNVPHYVLDRIARESTIWGNCKPILQEYVGMYYTQTEFNNYCEFYNY